MNIKLHILNTNGKLTGVEKIIQDSFDQAIPTIIQAIPVDNVDVVCYESIIRAIPHVGFGGYSLTSNIVMITVNSQFEGLSESLQQNLKRTLAHEFYHCLRHYAHDTKQTLLSALINEGLADHFALEITQLPTEKWDMALTPGQSKGLISRASKEFNNHNYNHTAWFFGSKELNIPHWTGYSLGFAMVGEYLKKHPESKPSNLYQIPAENFLLD
ncbi:hypothetical protein A3B57_00095 [Microgenomates group bacterium RIFCSPLOWO2_01_FULL_47_10]|nr:MAG: hypothetical protein A3B57_00095 [Microgenomates group bacterium RIFCSPLOWO2_01_FULL_47_10]